MPRTKQAATAVPDDVGSVLTNAGFGDKKNGKFIQKPQKILRADLQTAKSALEAKGWLFEQDADEMWSATKNKGAANEEFCGLHSSIAATINHAEGVETGHHEPGKHSQKDEFVSENSPTETFSEEMSHTENFQLISISQISPSPLEPQMKRRERIKEEDLTEFSSSIKKHSLINPLTVRLASNGFEIVAGERRWMGAQIAGLEKIPCVVRDLSDEETEEIQLLENIERKDLHPLDEAFWYQFLMSKPGATLTDVALRVGKSEAYVHQRLKLNDLCREAQRDFAENFLPIGHAMELAKYPAITQKEILDDIAYRFDNRDNGAVGFVEFKREIERKIHLKLKHAPFSLKATDLRRDKLPCTECPERTGYHPTLFQEQANADDDRCLNRNCYEQKIKNFILQQQKTLSEEMQKETGNSRYQAPLISVSWYSSEPSILAREKYTKIEKKKEACASAETGVYVDGDQIGQKQLICRSKTCEKHKPYSSSSGSSSAEQQEKEREKRLIRKEELFAIRTAEPVRRSVLNEAVGNFDEQNTIFNHKNSETYLIEMIARLWLLQCHHSDRTAGVIREIIELESEQLEINRWGGEGSIKKQIAKLGKTMQSKLLFLLLHAHLDENLDDYSFKPQKTIRDIAEDFNINYRLLDARQRFELAPKKHKETFKQYLTEVESGNLEVPAPRIYSDKWKPGK